MNPRERFLAAMTFGNPDLVPLSPGHGRESTRKTWHDQGLPAEIDDGDSINEYAYRAAGGKLPWPGSGIWFPLNERMIPQFEEKVIERREHSQIVQDWKGNVCEISLEFSPRHLREAIDFVTRRWVRCPIEGRADWEEMKKRYVASDSSRVRGDPADMTKRYAERDEPLYLNFSGPFWQMREWLGFERLCELFLEDPAWVQEMAEFWGEYVAQLLERAIRISAPDMVGISEDMAYKVHSMISPAMTRRFLLPVYRRWSGIIRKACPLFMVDSDGFVDELIPVWIEAGINACEPMEVAAGNDIAALRRKYGKDMAFNGGVDKRAIAKGGTAIEEEIRRLEPVIKSGGYIPGCDHGVPSNVPWSNYVKYVELLARSTGWL